MLIALSHGWNSWSGARRHAEIHACRLAATVQATEEAIVNAMVAAGDMDGTDGHYAKALPPQELIALLRRYRRLAPAR
ncbi:MAG TPA: hypothetical protein VFR36_04420 [Sphingomicrobium sp.]|nr:hypothetical protein [Sphingomicrobium sp.]